jgi:dienelactone hydrolase
MRRIAMAAWGSRLAAVLLTAGGIAPSPAFASEHFTLSATPLVALFDAPVQIRVEALAAGEPVTIEASARIDGTDYRSWAFFRANPQGLLDVSATAPIAGTYDGTDPMGLFWSMAPVKPPAYTPPSLEPFAVTLTVYGARGTQSLRLTRERVSPDVERIPLEKQPIVGTLFLHPADARGVVIVLGGSEGGMDENRAAIIASHGFDTLSLAYFGAPTLPRELANIPLEYVDRAVDWIRAQSALATLPILLEGDSKGSELALLAASRNSAIGGVVAFAPASEIFEGFSTKQGAQRASWTLDAAPLPFSNNPVPASVKAAIQAERAAKRPVSFRDQYLAIATPPALGSTIHVEHIRGPLLLIAGADDQLWPSDIFATRILGMRRSHQVTYADEALIYPNAGHQIDVPFMQTTGLAAFHEGSFTLALGGTARGYARADAAMWSEVIAFLNRACKQSATLVRPGKV